MSKEYLFKYISAVSEINLATGLSFGRTIIAQVLTGSKSKNVLRFNNLDCYGKGTGKAQSWWIAFSKNISKIPDILKEKISENASNNVIITFELGVLGKDLLSNYKGIVPEIELPEVESFSRKTGSTSDSATSQEHTYKMFSEQGKTIAEIAKERGLKSSTITQHLLDSKNNGKDVQQKMLIDNKTFEKIKAAWLEIGGDRLKPIKEYLGENFTYEDIRLAKAFIN